MRSTFATLAMFSLPALVPLAGCSDDASASPETETLLDAGNDVKDSVDDDGAPSDTGVDARAGVMTTPRTVTCGASPCAVDLVAGGSTYCAGFDDGTVRCWGSNVRGNLGRGDTDAEPASGIPAPVVGLTKISRVVGSPDGSFCASSEASPAKCWGDNSGGQLGRYDEAGNPVSSSLATPMTPSGAPTGRMFMGSWLTCAAPDSGDIVCWGTDNGRVSAVVGEGVRPRATPVDLGGKVFSELVITGSNIVAWAKSSELLSWGSSGGGLDISALGRISSIGFSPPDRIALDGISQIAGSGRRVCAVAFGRVYCWGPAPAGQNTGSKLPAYVRFVTGANVDSVAVGDAVHCATFDDETSRCWGDNAYAQLGAGDTAAYFAPIEVRGLAAPAVRFAVGVNSTCALLRDGRVQCWGWNTEGQLGRGTHDARTHREPETVKWER